MKKALVLAAVGCTFATASLVAQGLSSSVCPPGTSTAGIPNSQRVAQDACQQAYDVYQVLAPQLGLALAGGNATIGQGGVLGGIGHFSVGVRVNAVKGQLPQVNDFTQSTNGAVQNVLPSKDQFVPLPTADAAIGIFKGFPLALTNIFGLDALVSAAYIPTITSDNVNITPQKNWQFGYGARLGLLSESIVVPGVSVTWIERDLPTTDIVGTRGADNGSVVSPGGSGTATLSVTNLTVKTSAWRVVASKSFIVFGLAAGVGQDSYNQSAEISASVNQGVFSGQSSPPNTSQTLKRTNIFGDLSLNLPIFKIVAEVGQASGGTVNTFNSFSGGRADKSQVYGSAGIRLSW